MLSMVRCLVAWFDVVAAVHIYQAALRDNERDRQASADRAALAAAQAAATKAAADNRQIMLQQHVN
jgi:hypothetical protein